MISSQKLPFLLTTDSPTERVIYVAIMLPSIQFRKFIDFLTHQTPPPVSGSNRIGKALDKTHCAKRERDRETEKGRRKSF